MRIKTYMAETVRAAIEQARAELGPDAMLLNTRRTTEPGSPPMYEVVFGTTGNAPRAQLEPPASVAPAEPVRATNPSPAPRNAKPGPAVPPPLPVPSEPRMVEPLTPSRQSQAPFRQPFAHSHQLPPQAALPLPGQQSAAKQPPPLPTQPVGGARQRAVASQVAEPLALTELRRMVSEMHTLLEDAAGTRSRQPAQPPELARVWEQKLLDYNFEPAVAQSILAAVTGEAGSPVRPISWTPSEFDFAVRRELQRSIPCSSLFESLGRSATFAMVGPPGAGKTTTLASVAVRYGLARGHRVHFVSFDPHHAAGTGGLERIAFLADLPFTNLNTTTDLLHFLCERRPAGQILIDLPGYSKAEQAEADEMAHILRACGPVETHLVIPASMRARDLMSYAQMYAAFAPRSVIASRMDETADMGGIISVCRTMGIPVSLTKNGQDLPDSVRTARGPEFLEDLFHSEARVAASVA